MNTKQLDDIALIVGAEIAHAVEPLLKRIAELEGKFEKELGDMASDVQDAVKTMMAQPEPKDGAPGKDCDMDAVKAELKALVDAIPVQNGKDGEPGKDGANGTDGQSVKLEDVQPLIVEAVKSMQAEVQDFIKSVPMPQDGKSVTLEDVKPILDAAMGDIRKESAAAVEMILKDGRIEREAMQSAIKELRQPADGLPGKDGENGKDGAPGQKGADGIGLAGAMIDREGDLLVTMTNGEVKSLGAVVGKDGANGSNGADGISLDTFDMQYIEETHEVCIKASAAGRVKELRYPAGGIRPGGYWREGTKVKACETWVHDGSLWIAVKDTVSQPKTGSDDWIIGARKGRDGERGQKGSDGTPPAPISLKG